MDDLYNANELDVNSINDIPANSITERDKFDAAKKILLGLAFLYILTMIAYCIKPVEGGRLLDIVATPLSSLATLILAQYFKDKN